MKNIDIFCEIIDNFGDIGVTYRLAKDLTTKNYSVRIFINGFSELSVINNEINNNKVFQTLEGITYINLDKLSNEAMKNIETSEIVIEAFATYPSDIYISNIKNKQTLILNLEYLSAERSIEDYHLIESLTGVDNIKKYFFMQGFTAKTGGIVLGYEYLAKKNNRVIYNNRDNLILNVYTGGDIVNLSNKKIISIFTYEYNFNNLIRSLNELSGDFILLLFGNKTKKSFRNNLKLSNKDIYYKKKNIEYMFMPYYDQSDFDIFLLTSDLNIVRGEESFVRAILSDKPFIWHSYLQDNKTHMKKVDAFLELYKKYFKSSEDYKIILDIFYEFNNRDMDSYHRNTSYSTFLSYFKLIFEKNIDYPKISKHLIKKCDLADNLDKFIKICIK